MGSNGVGKSTLAQNMGYQAVMQGQTVLLTSAALMLNDLAAQVVHESSLKDEENFYSQNNEFNNQDKFTLNPSYVPQKTSVFDRL